MHALGVDQLDKVVECLTMWLVHDSSSAKTAFGLWADMKHNIVSEGKTDHLVRYFNIIVKKTSYIHENNH